MRGGGEFEGRWRRRREQSWLLLVAAAAVVLSQWHGPAWVLAVLAGVAGVGGVVLAFVKESVQDRDGHDQVLEQAIWTAGDTAKRPPTVAETTMGQMGVHRALVKIGYLNRDAGRELEQVLASGAPVLVVGNSMAGKTTLAAETLHAHYPDRPIIIPDVPGGLAELMNAGGLPQDTVIWLDDQPGGTRARRPLCSRAGGHRHPSHWADRFTIDK